MQEQAGDVARQTQLKHNVRLADERWAAKAKYIEPPKPVQEQPPAQLEHEGVKGTERKARDTGSSGGSDWQPTTWVPGPAKR